MQTTHPARHMDTGVPCPSDNPGTCELAFPGTHHRPRHCKPVMADRTSSVQTGGRHVKSQLELAQSAMDAAAIGRPFLYETTGLVPDLRGNR